MALLEERRRKLAAEGLFDEARKQLLPYLPRVIGVVTSPTGAVIRDILHRLEDRFPCHVLVWPVRVQGETSAAEVAAAIRGFNALPEAGPPPRPDLIIVARGGGSLEDLWSFNEEIVVRAAAESFVPLIAAVGHETDWTLIDYAADLRAPTPTAAAEKAVPVRSELLAALADLGRRHAGAMFRLVERERAELRALARALPRGDALVAVPRQRLDTASSRLAGTMSRAQDRRRIGLAGLAHRLSRQSPHARLAKVGERLGGLGLRLRRAQSTGQERRRQALGHAGARLFNARSSYTQLARERVISARQRLESLSRRLEHGIVQRLVVQRRKIASLGQILGTLGYRQVLARGFALVRDEDGTPIRLAAAIVEGVKLDLEFADGHRPVVAGTAPKAPTKKPVKRASRKREQSSLF
jgi:exodeoxyribonuclease VII large subunit